MKITSKEGKERRQWGAGGMGGGGGERGTKKRHCGERWRSIFSGESAICGGGEGGSQAFTQIKHRGKTFLVRGSDMRAGYFSLTLICGRGGLSLFPSDTRRRRLFELSLKCGRKLRNCTLRLCLIFPAWESLFLVLHSAFIEQFLHLNII
jgi:hypothetical protein